MGHLVAIKDEDGDCCDGRSEGAPRSILICQEAEGYKSLKNNTLKSVQMTKTYSSNPQIESHNL
jgi:N-formylglutamate amidohydrolase